MLFVCEYAVHAKHYIVMAFLSLCLSNAGIVSKQTDFVDRLVGHNAGLFEPQLRNKIPGTPSAGALKMVKYTRVGNFANIALCL